MKKQLHSRPNLEHLRREAKALLASLPNSEAVVAAAGKNRQFSFGRRAVCRRTKRRFFKLAQARRPHRAVAGDGGHVGFRRA